MKNVQFVRGQYRARMVVPEELRKIIGKRELVEALGADKKIAHRKALAALNRFHEILEEAKQKLELSKPTLSDAAKAHYRRELVFDDLERQTMGTKDHAQSKSLVDITRPLYASKLRLIAQGKIAGEEAEALIGFGADTLQKEGLVPGVPRAELLKILAAVHLEALKVSQARDAGSMIEPEPKNELLKAPDRKPETPDEDPTASDGDGMTLDRILGLFHKERTSRKRTLAAATLKEQEVAVRMFREFMGKDMPVAAIKRKHVVEYKQSLLQTPTNYRQRFPGLTLPQAIRRNKDRSEPYPTLDPKTINMKWLSCLSSILTWAVNNGYIEHNPASGVKADVGRKEHSEPARLPFSPSDLKSIFRHSMFADRKAFGTKQWALLLALYTGARSAEIARIKLADIYEEQGKLVIHLSGATKNVRSKRLVPVHQKLIEFGLSDYAAKLKAKGEERLFPDWEPEDSINRWFLRSFRNEVGIVDEGKVFHSFRHTLKTALARAGVPRDVSDKITGHADQSVAGVYIHDPMIKAMSDAINKLDFEIQ
jgi:integrase